MTFTDFWDFMLFAILLIALTPPLGIYLYQVFTGKETSITLLFQWLEKFCYKLANVDPSIEMSASCYMKNMLLFNFFGFFAILFLMLTQSILPLNPEGLENTTLHLAFNTAISFVTNTNWQSYRPETTLSYLTNMLGLTVQNFLSAGTGLAVSLAFMRGIIRKEIDTIGNFWQDLVRTIVYILLPLSIILAILLMTEGVIQNFSAYQKITTLEGKAEIIPLGPVASQVAIKQLGTNGGGFFSTNSAHPFENPTAFSNLLQTLAILLIPSAIIYFYGLYTGMKKHALILYGVIFFLFFAGYLISIFGEHLVGVNLGYEPVLEGKEVRFSLQNSVLWSTATTASANGSTNLSMTSLSPIASGIALFNLMSGESIFGGIGVGLISLLMYVLLTVFLAGLMVGRTPEYFGKKIESKEILWVTIAILAPAALILVGSAVSTLIENELLKNGPHGLTTILYTFSSTAGNNGSAFLELDTNTPYYNYLLGVVMLLGRVSVLIPALMIASLLAKKKASPPSIGTFSTQNFLFGILLFAVILIVGALTFFPALAVGPIMETILMLENRYF